MKLIIIVILLLFPAFIYSQEDAKQINKRITEIRQNTNWNNAEEAKKANEEIKKLSRQLILLKQKKSGNEDIQKIQEENVDAKMKLWDEILKSANQGEGADINLGKPVREEIIEEYKDDESPIIKNGEYFEEMTLLVIDMSLKTVQRTIGQMERFKNVKTLVITGGSFGAAVNLSDILSRAKEYPLEKLYIINFRNFVTELPKEVFNFKGLKLLSLINNRINSLPPGLNNLQDLIAVYLDLNPVPTVLPEISRLTGLQILGAGNTDIPDSEFEEISRLLPNCKVILE